MTSTVPIAAYRRDVSGAELFYFPIRNPLSNARANRVAVGISHMNLGVTRHFRIDPVEKFWRVDEKYGSTRRFFCALKKVARITKGM